MTNPPATILAASDAGLHPDEIAARLGLSLTHVYSVLRVERPNRVRKPRVSRTTLPAQIRGLLAKGIKPARVAFLLGVTRQYVYRFRVSVGRDH